MLLAQQALRHGGAPRIVHSRVRHFGEVGAPPVEIHLVTELLSCVSSALPTAVPTLFHAVLQANTALRAYNCCRRGIGAKFPPPAARYEPAAQLAR